MKVIVLGYDCRVRFANEVRILGTSEEYCIDKDAKTDFKCDRRKHVALRQKHVGSPAFFRRGLNLESTTIKKCRQRTLRRVH